MKSGLIKVIENFYSKELDEYKNIKIYLPPDYYKNNTRYPVIYIQSEETLFDIERLENNELWDIKGQLDNLYKEYGLGIIVVNIEPSITEVYAQFSPFKDELMTLLLNDLDDVELSGGKGNEYSKFIVESLKPYIDGVYRTIDGREGTFITGIGMGGLIALYTGLKYQEVFLGVGGISSALFFARKKLVEYFKALTLKEDLKVYMDVGTRETSNKEYLDFPSLYLDSNIEVYRVLLSKELKEENIKFFIDEGAKHSKIAWNKRIKDMILFLFFN